MLVLTFSFITCNGRRGSNGTSNTSGNQDSEGDQAVSQVQQGLPINEDEQGWPSGKIYQVPEWVGISKYFGGGRSLDEYADKGAYTMSVVASEDSLNRFLDTLQRAGFEISDNSYSPQSRDYTAERGLVRLDIVSTRLGNERGYQINFELQQIGVWPRYALPDFIKPMEGKILVDNPVLYLPGQDLRDVNGVWVDDSGFNFQFTYTDLSMLEAVMYMNDAASQMVNGIYSNESYLDYGGFGFIKGISFWNNQRYYVYGEVIQLDRSTYNFLFGWATEEQGW